MKPISFRSTSQRAQKTFFDPDVLLEKRPLKPDSFYVRFRAVCDEVIPDALFSDLYTGFGRPARVAHAGTAPDGVREVVFRHAVRAGKSIATEAIFPYPN